MPRLGKVQRRRLVETVDLSLPEIDTDAWSWRRITDASPRNLPDYNHRRMLEVSLYLYRFNPLAHRGVGLMRDYVVGSGVRVETKSEVVGSIIKKFWNNPIHNMDKLLRLIAFELSLYGEVIVPAVANEHNGDVTLGYISPFQIQDVFLNPKNLLQFDKVVLLKDPSAGDKDLKVIRVEQDVGAKVKPDDLESPSTYNRRVGDCFYFAVNRVGDASRGLSDLLAVADFIDCLDQLVFNSLERMTHEAGWMWDVEMTGASDAQIRKQTSDLETSPPRPGAFLVHNEWVKWKPMEIGLKAQNIKDEATLIRNYVLSGMGLPVHFFGEPSAGGRAVAEAMAAPTYQSLSVRQTEVAGFLREILDFVIDQKIVHGMIKEEEEDLSYDIIMPKISLRDLQRTGGAMFRITQSLATAQEKGWIDTNLGERLFKALVEQLGLGVTVVEDKEEDDEEEDRLGDRVGDGIEDDDDMEGDEEEERVGDRVGDRVRDRVGDRVEGRP